MGDERGAKKRGGVADLWEIWDHLHGFLLKLGVLQAEKSTISW
jgi:hypothetical protein